MHGGTSASRSISHISLKDLAPSCLIAMSQWRRVIDIRWSTRAVRYSSCLLLTIRTMDPIKKKQVNSLSYLWGRRKERIAAYAYRVEVRLPEHIYTMSKQTLNHK